MRCNLLAPDRQQIANELESRAAFRRIPRIPIEHGGSKCLFVQRIRNVVAEFGVGGFELLAPTLAHRLRELTLEVAEKWERPLRSPFLSHEQQRRHGRQQRYRERR